MKILIALFGTVALLGSILAVRPEAAFAACDSNYQGVCLPVFTGTDNIDCDSPEVTLSNFPASVSDPYHLDADHDGIACDKNGRPGYQALKNRVWTVMVARDEPAPPPTPTRTAMPGQATATPSLTPTRTSAPTATPTNAPSAHTWYTSAASSAKYYYCDLDDGWKSLSPANLRSYPSEAALLAVWGSSRTKHPDSHC